MSLSQALQAAAALGVQRLDAQLLLLRALGRDSHERAWLLAHDQDFLSVAADREFIRFCERRARGEPLAYITGRREFFGLDLQVDSRVLVPRPETETLVEWALDVIGSRPHARVIDLGTGSGAIALAIKNSRPHVHVTATDASAAALEVAAANAGALQLDIELRRASWLAGVPGTFDLIVSNPPYIAAHDKHLSELAHEPRGALVSGGDGLHDLRTIIGQAPMRLAPGGWLLLEHGHDQARAVRGLMAAAGFSNVESRRDLADIERCGGAQRLELG